jgi:hypothetical protein
MRTQSDAHEDWIAHQIEAAAHLTPGSINMSFGAAWTYRVVVLQDGDTDRALWSWECDSYIDGLRLVAAQLGVEWPEPALATLSEEAA